jgi:hypothetical protein
VRASRCALITDRHCGAALLENHELLGVMMHMERNGIARDLSDDEEVFRDAIFLIDLDRKGKSAADTGGAAHTTFTIARLENERVRRCEGLSCLARRLSGNVLALSRVDKYGNGDGYQP